MVANSHQNSTIRSSQQNSSTSQTELPSSASRQYPGLNRLDCVHDSVKKSVLETPWDHFGNDGAALSFGPSDQNYSTFFQSSSTKPEAIGWIQRQFAECETVNQPERIRTEAFTCEEDLVEDLLEKHYQMAEFEVSQPVFIFEPDFQKAAELGRRLSALGQKTHLASTFSNWANVMGRLGGGLIDVVVSTTLEIPMADQIPWSTVYVPSVQCLRATTDPEGWIGKLILRQQAASENFEVVVG